MFALCLRVALCCLFVPACHCITHASGFLLHLAACRACAALRDIRIHWTPCILCHAARAGRVLCTWTWHQSRCALSPSLSLSLSVICWGPLMPANLMWPFCLCTCMQAKLRITALILQPAIYKRGSGEADVLWVRFCQAGYLWGGSIFRRL